ncbi:MAG: alpha/beta fold hydrolase [Spirochaetales bacterium]
MRDIASVLRVTVLFCLAPLLGCAGAPPSIEPFPEQASRYVEIDGARIHYFDFHPTVEALPIVWVHGYAGAAYEALYVSELIDQRVIAVDLPGSGLSEKPDAVYSIERFAEVIVALIDALHIDRFVLVGHSLGGAVAATIAAESRIKHRIDRLVLVAPYGLPNQAGRFLEFLSDRRALVRLGMLFYNERMLERFLRRNTFYDPEAAPQALANYYNYALFYTEGGIDALARVTTDVIGTPLAPQTLPSIVAPTLIIWGRNDEVLSPEGAECFAELIPSSELALLARSGHLPHVERPGAVAFLLARFVGPAL